MTMIKQNEQQTSSSEKSDSRTTKTTTTLEAVSGENDDMTKHLNNNNNNNNRKCDNNKIKNNDNNKHQHDMNGVGFLAPPQYQQPKTKKRGYYGWYNFLRQMMTFTLFVGLRICLLEGPILFLFVCTTGSYYMIQTSEQYYIPQIALQIFTKNKAEQSITYYDNTCTEQTSQTSYDTNDLFIIEEIPPQSFSQQYNNNNIEDEKDLVMEEERMRTKTIVEDAKNKMLKHGVIVFPNLLQNETLVNELRTFILNENQRSRELIYVIDNSYRWSFPLRVDQHNSVTNILHELLHPIHNKIFIQSLETIMGPNPAIIEFTAITAAYQASNQFWHQDVVPSTSGAKYSRSFIPSYSLFIPLQNVSSSMGATGICPGSHMCTNGPSTYCQQTGFQVSHRRTRHKSTNTTTTTNTNTSDIWIDEDNWPMGYGALLNQQLTHRGAAHRLLNGPDRVVFILTFAPRPVVGSTSTTSTTAVVETKLIGQAGSYSLHWTHWGHTIRDFQNSQFYMKQPYRILRSLGLYYDDDTTHHHQYDHSTNNNKNVEWGWDYITVASGRIANGDTGYTDHDLDEFMMQMKQFIMLWKQHPSMNHTKIWNYHFFFSLIRYYFMNYISRWDEKMIDELVSKPYQPFTTSLLSSTTKETIHRITKQLPWTHFLLNLIYTCYIQFTFLHQVFCYTYIALFFGKTVIVRIHNNHNNKNNNNNVNNQMMKQTTTTKRFTWPTSLSLVVIFLLHILIHTFFHRKYQSITESTWGRNIQYQRSYNSKRVRQHEYNFTRGPSFDEEDDIDYVDDLLATLPTRYDVMIMDHMQSSYLYSYENVLDTFHYGNARWYDQYIQPIALSYVQSLSIPLQHTYRIQLLQWTQQYQHGRILIQNVDTTNWVVLTYHTNDVDDKKPNDMKTTTTPIYTTPTIRRVERIHRIVDQFCHKSLLYRSSSNYQKAETTIIHHHNNYHHEARLIVLHQIDELLAETKYGYWRDTMLHQKYIPKLLRQIQNDILWMETTYQTIHKNDNNKNEKVPPELVIRNKMTTPTTTTRKLSEKRKEEKNNCKICSEKNRKIDQFARGDSNMMLQNCERIPTKKNFRFFFNNGNQVELEETGSRGDYDNVNEPYPAAWLKEGDYVEAAYKGNMFEWYTAVVTYASSNQYVWDVAYMDGEIEMNVCTKCIRPFVPFQVGEHVEGRVVIGEDNHGDLEYEYQTGVVLSADSHADKYTITLFDTGMKLENYTSANIRRYYEKPSYFPVNTRIESRYPGEPKTKWFPGWIAKVHTRPTSAPATSNTMSYAVSFDDGDYLEHVAHADIRMLQEVDDDEETENDDDDE